MIKISSDIHSKRHESLDKTNENESKKAKSQESIESELGELKISGLCASCAEKNKCPLTKFDGGVWHCEGYVESVKGTN